MGTDVAARTTPLGEVLIAAADIDPAAAQLLAEASSNRMLGATVFIRYGIPAAEAVRATS